MTENFANPAETPEPQEDKTKTGDIILNRIIEETGIPNIFDSLNDIPSTDFQSLVLEIMDKKSLKIGVKELNSALENNPFVKKSEVDQITFIKFDSLAYNLLPSNYKGIELSPLVPFATNKVLADISQKRVLSTSRNSEVISDPTTALALYCAKERMDRIKKDHKDSESINVATSQRVARQNKLKKEVQTQHFRTFTLSAAGRDVGFEKFEKENLKEHLVFFLSLLEKLNESKEYSINDIRVVVSNVGGKKELLEIIKTDVITELIDLFPEVDFEFDTKRESKYYNSLCYNILAKNKKHDEPFTVVGGGMTDWTAALIGSKKERLIFGSVGSEILGRYFKE